MLPRQFPPRTQRRRSVFVTCGLAALLALSNSDADGRQARIGVLRIGATGTLSGKADSAKEKAGAETLHRFIKDETGLENAIVGQVHWQDLVGKMAKGQLHIGVFQGHEFAWAQEKHPDLKPLAIGVNGQRYSVAIVLANRDNPANDFAGLQGQQLAMPSASRSFLRLFVDRQCASAGKKTDAFFSQITTPDDLEDTLDDVVDGKVQAIVVEQAAVEAFKRRKPGRFLKLKEVLRSQPFPPTVVAYFGATLDESTLRKFKDGLLGAARKEKGEMLLTLSKLSGFETVPDDFARVIAETRKHYPPPSTKAE